MSDKDKQTIIILALTILLVIVLIDMSHGKDSAFQAWGCAVGYFQGDGCK
jgi:hypothetical protein